MRKLFIASSIIILGVAAWKLYPRNEKSMHQHDEYNHHDHEHHDHILFSNKQIDEFGIELKNVESGLIHFQLLTRGKIILHPDHLAHILPKVSGVAKIAYKNVGDSVTIGDVLAIIESKEIGEIKANYLAATEKERLTRTFLEREKKLHEKKVSAEQDYFLAKSAFEEAKINTQLAKQKLYAYGLTESEINQLNNQVEPHLCAYEIRSPLEGTVINRHITQGEFIEDTMTIYEIANLSKLWIEIGIYPKDLQKVKEGQIVQIQLPGENLKAEAKIIYISPIVQDETITAKAVAEMPNYSQKWRPGSFVQVTISTDNIPAKLMISKEAMQDIDGKSVVFVRMPEGFEKRTVKIGKNDSAHIEVLAGLDVGEVYAASNTFLLKAELGKHEVEHEH